MSGQCKTWSKRQSTQNGRIHVSSCSRSPSLKVALRARLAQPQRCLARDPDSVSSHSCTRKGFMISSLSILASAVYLGSPDGADALSCQGMRPYELQQCLKEKRAAQEQEVCPGDSLILFKAPKSLLRVCCPSVPSSRPACVPVAVLENMPVSTNLPRRA